MPSFQDFGLGALKPARASRRHETCGHSGLRTWASEAWDGLLFPRHAPPREPHRGSGPRNQRHRLTPCLRGGQETGGDRENGGPPLEMRASEPSHLIRQSTDSGGATTSSSVFSVPSCSILAVLRRVNATSAGAGKNHQKPKGPSPAPPAPVRCQRSYRERCRASLSVRPTALWCAGCSVSARKKPRPRRVKYRYRRTARRSRLGLR